LAKDDLVHTGKSSADGDGKTEKVVVDYPPTSSQEKQQKLRKKEKARETQPSRRALKISGTGFKSPPKSGQ